MRENDIDIEYLTYIQSHYSTDRKRAMAYEEAERGDTDKGFKRRI